MKKTFGLKLIRNNKTISPYTILYYGNKKLPIWAVRDKHYEASRFRNT
jgi:hypothetical protein